jgi:hypothetical protein
MNPMPLKILRLFYWSSLTIVIATPCLGIIYSLFGHELTLTAGILAYWSFFIQCVCCARLIEPEPELARRGMICLGIFLFVVFFSGALLGPIRG